MKKVIKTMMVMLVASAFVLTSCKDDDDSTIEDVKLTLNPAATSGTHGAGTILRIVVNGKGNSDNKLKQLTITKAPSGSATVTLASEKLSGTDKIYDLVDTLPDEVPQGQSKIDITYTIKLEGEKGTAQTVTYVASVVNMNPIEVLPANGLTLSAQLTASGGTHFLNLSDFSPYSTDLSKEDWEEKVDIGYFYGAENKHTLASPKNTTLQGRYSGLSSFFANSRTTGLFKVPASEGTALYNQVIADDHDVALSAYANGKTFTDLINNLATNDVVLFKTQEGKFGLIKIGTVEGNSESTGKLPIGALVQVK